MSDVDPHQDDETSELTGDDVYLELGFNGIDKFSSNLFLVPSTRDHKKMVAAYKIKLKFYGEENIIEKSIPFDDFIMFISSLSRTTSITRLEDFASQLDSLNFDKRSLSNATKMAIEKLTSLLETIEKLPDDDALDRAD
ncbi:hypothetical protein [Agrobacterium cavarae]|uniref:hypothetical protein n=1 Tax=Agrobacterium cavarae TaxID=2528239 RepID=UPI00289739B5|nr:hypothetical protein [Agrobacterium cavarae]